MTERDEGVGCRICAKRQRTNDDEGWLEEYWAASFVVCSVFYSPLEIDTFILLDTVRKIFMLKIEEVKIVIALY